MNLLIDQREESTLPEPDWTPQQEEQPASPILQEPALPKGAETPLDYYSFEEPESRKRGILGPILIILLLLAAIGAAAYYGFFYKPQELGELRKPAAAVQPAATEPAPAVTGSVPSTSAPATEAGGGNLPAETPTATAEPAATAPVATTAPAVEAATGSPLARATALLGGILAARPAELQLSTLILDQNSFSAEVSAGSRSIIANYAEALKNSIPGGLASSPASGYYSGARALVTGTYPDLTPSATPVLAGESVVRLRQELRSKAQEAGLKVIEVSQAREMDRDGAAWTPVFVKISGSEEQFQQYCATLAAGLPLMRLDKIILQSRGEQVVGVIRFEAQTR